MWVIGFFLPLYYLRQYFHQVNSFFINSLRNGQHISFFFEELKKFVAMRKVLSRDEKQRTRYYFVRNAKETKYLVRVSHRGRHFPMARNFLIPKEKKKTWLSHPEERFMKKELTW